MPRTVLLLSVLALAAAAPAAAQVPVPADTSRPPADTAARPAPARPAAAPARADSAAPRISPKGAFIRSVVVPGWGQSELGAGGRGGFYFAMEAGSLFMVYKSWTRLDEARARERALRAAGALEPGQTTGLVRARKAQREDWITLALFWMFFSGADAFVTAQLADFDEHVRAAPGPGGGVQMQLNVPVGRRP